MDFPLLLSTVPLAVSAFHCVWAGKAGAPWQTVNNKDEAASRLDSQGDCLALGVCAHWAWGAPLVLLCTSEMGSCSNIERGIQGATGRQQTAPSLREKNDMSEVLGSVRLDALSHVLGNLLPARQQGGSCPEVKADKEA
jgi:hypothetical protein